MKHVKRLIRLAILATGLAAISPQLCGEIHLLAVADAASYTPGLPLPGGLGAIFCTGLTDVSGVLQAEGSAPRSLGGVQVLINETAVPILMVASLGEYQQINFQVPWDARQAISVTVTQGKDRAALPVPMQQHWGIFFTDAAGYVAARHVTDQSVVTPGNPARPGEWVTVYASNIGPVENPPESGEITPLAPLSPLRQGSDNYTPLLVWQEQNTTLATNFMGLAPGLTGVYQLNLLMPATLPAGEVELRLQRRRFCGFFFIPGCGRGFVLTVSLGARLPVAP